jgi:hypothetical protein
MGAFEGCFKFASQYIRAITFELVKCMYERVESKKINTLKIDDPNLDLEIPEKMKDYKIDRLQDGTPYSCPSVANPTHYSTCVFKVYKKKETRKKKNKKRKRNRK